MTANPSRLATVTALPWAGAARPQVSNGSVLHTFGVYLDGVGIAPDMRATYLWWMDYVLDWCDDNGVTLESVGERERFALANRIAVESRYNLVAALSYWLACWDTDSSVATGWQPALVGDAAVALPDEYEDEEWEDDPADSSIDLLEQQRHDVADMRSTSFERYLVSVGLSRKTIRAYSRWLGVIERQLADMGTTLDHADGYQLAQLASETPLTHSTRAQLRATLKHYYTWKDRLNAPLRAVRVPPSPRMVNRALSAQDTRVLVEACRGSWPKGGVVLLGLYLALRRAEIAAAEWGRFDDNMEWYRVTGKGDKTATIPVHPVIREEFGPRRGTGYIFPGRTGVRDHISPATAWTWSKQVAEQAGIGKITTHQLRHTSLTTALDNTENLRSVMEFARHERPDVTAGYTRTTREQLRRVSEALDF